MRTYSRDFKLKALERVAQLRELGARRGPVAQVARELGLDEKLLHRWKREYAANPDKAFPAS